MRPIHLLVLTTLLLAAPGMARAACPPDPGGATVVEMLTNQGEICIRMYETGAGYTETVPNFLGYVTRGDYDGTFIHRSAPGFVIQGGNFRFANDTYQATCSNVSPCTEVPNEFEALSALRNCGPAPGSPQICNLRGTLSMARSTPDNATSQWFINLGDNPGLDSQAAPKGFVTFAEVTSGMDVVDAIASLPILDGEALLRTTLRSAFGSLPITSVLPGGECFDPDDIAIVGSGGNCTTENQFPPTFSAVPDPELESFYLVSPPCFASPVTCPGQELSLTTCGVIRDADRTLVFDPEIFRDPSTLTLCGALESSDLSREALAPAAPSRLVLIEHAIVVPEPSAALTQLTMLGALAALRRRRSRAGSPRTTRSA